MDHLIEPSELLSLGRPIGKSVGTDKLLAYITETEQLYIKPALGDTLLLDILENGDTREDYRLLLNGGAYSDDCGNTYTFMGLKVTVAYYVYAQNIMSGDFNSTRYGMVLKDGEYSSRLSSKERSDHYNNTLEVAHQYLKDCIAYCKRKGILKCKKNTVLSTGGLTIRKIG